MKQTKIALTLIFLLAVFQSCTVMDKLLGRDYKYWREKYEGEYVSNKIFPDGRPFSISLRDDGRFVEHNYWGEMYGYWTLSRANKWRKMDMLRMRTDSVKSSICFHNDDGESLESTMYFYNKNTHGKGNTVSLKDRGGHLMPIYDAYFYDSSGGIIQEYHRSDKEYESVEIPNNTYQFNIYGINPNSSNGICKNYCKDSGDVVFVLLPNYNDLFRTLTNTQKKLRIEIDGEYKYLERLY